jgi:hypothetical protein
MFSGLVELPEGHVVFSKVWLSFFVFWERHKGPRTSAMGKVYACQECSMPISLGGPTHHTRDTLETINLSPWQSDPLLEFNERLNRSKHGASHPP